MQHQLGRGRHAIIIVQSEKHRKLTALYQIDMLNETHNAVPISEKKTNVCSALNLADVLNLITQSNALEKTALQLSKSFHGIRQQLKFCSSSFEINQGCFVAFGSFT
jgi:hypothetical protein